GRELRDRRHELSGLVRILLPASGQIHRGEVESIASRSGQVAAAFLVRGDGGRLTNGESARAKKEFGVSRSLQLIRKLEEFYRALEIGNVLRCLPRLVSIASCFQSQLGKRAGVGAVVPCRLQSRSQLVVPVHRALNGRQEEVRLGILGIRRDGLVGRIQRQLQLTAPVERISHQQAQGRIVRVLLHSERGRFGG